MLLFALLLALISAAQALGATATEALLLGTLGVTALPGTIFLAALAAVVGSLGYTTVVGRWRHDTLMALLLAAVAAVIGAGWLGRSSVPLTVLLPGLYGVFSMGMAVLMNHFWTQAGDCFDPLAQKRLFPRLTLGASLGGFCGGLAASVAMRWGMSAYALLPGWACLLAAAALLVLSQQRRLRGWSQLGLAPPPPLGQTLVGPVRFLQRSPLGRGMLVMLVGMVFS
ncbi:MAG: hypothetical protein AB1758_03420, partial [Candidatus Eremiobacterota bacterium]